MFSLGQYILEKKEVGKLCSTNPPNEECLFCFEDQCFKSWPLAELKHWSLALLGNRELSKSNSIKPNFHTYKKK